MERRSTKPEGDALWQTIGAELAARFAVANVATIGNEGVRIFENPGVSIRREGRNAHESTRWNQSSESFYLVPRKSFCGDHRW